MSGKKLHTLLVISMLLSMMLSVVGCSQAAPTPAPPTATKAPVKPEPTSTTAAREDKLSTDPLNATYIIEGQAVTLVNGKAEKEIVPGAASKLKTTVFGEPAIGDLNGDGANDAALIIVQDPGGSGTFFYVVASVKDRQSGQYVGTNGILLGDRIAPQNIAIEKGAILVNYATRAKDEPMSAPPSIGVTMRLVVDGKVLKKVEPY